MTQNDGKNDLPVVQVEYPAWVAGAIDLQRTYATDEERMRVAMARQ